VVSFLRSIAERLSRATGGPIAGNILVAAFGKHPGWKDHMEDIGLEAEMLVAAKRLIYVQGIGENIARGAWKELRQDQRLDAFRHSFVWRRQGEVVAGRMWSSQDGSGRKCYPMIVCAYGRGLSIHWVFRCILPRFETLEAECRLSRTAVEVRARLHAFQNDLRRLAKGEEQATRLPQISFAEAFASIVALLGLSSSDEGLMRILYHLDRELGGFVTGRDAKAEPVSRAFLRVPAPVGQGTEAAALWLRFLSAGVSESTHTFVFMPHGETCVDLIVGEPTENELYCLRATPQAVRLTSDIPYNIDRVFMERAKSMFAGHGSASRGS